MSNDMSSSFRFEQTPEMRALYSKLNKATWKAESKEALAKALLPLAQNEHKLEFGHWNDHPVAQDVVSLLSPRIPAIDKTCACWRMCLWLLPARCCLPDKSRIGQMVFAQRIRNVFHRLHAMGTALYQDEIASPLQPKIADDPDAREALQNAKRRVLKEIQESLDDSKWVRRGSVSGSNIRRDDLLGIGATAYAQTLNFHQCQTILRAIKAMQSDNNMHRDTDSQMSELSSALSKRSSELLPLLSHDEQMLVQSQNRARLKAWLQRLSSLDEFFKNDFLPALNAWSKSKVELNNGAGSFPLRKKWSEQERIRRHKFNVLQNYMIDLAVAWSDARYDLRRLYESHRTMQTAQIAMTEREIAVVGQRSEAAREPELDEAYHTNLAKYKQAEQEAQTASERLARAAED